MSNYYDTFRKKSSSFKCSNSIKANLISNAAGTTSVLHRRTNKNIEVNLIIANKTEGLGTAKVYSWAKDDLKVGDYIVWQSVIFIVTEQENNVLLDENIHKFAARECNVKVGYLIDDELKYFDGVFIGKGASASQIKNKTSDGTPAFIIDNKDILIFAGESLPRFIQCVIRDEQWNVADWDSTTNYPLYYTTIIPTAATIVPTEEPIVPSVQKYKEGVKYSFKTENYYFSSTDIFQYTRYKDNVEITMPYGVDRITFNTKVNNTVVTNVIDIDR